MPDQFIFEGLKINSNDAYAALYQWYFPSVKNFIVKNSGSSSDADDVFQDTLLVLLKKIQAPDFVLTASLKTYVFAISTNLWLKKLRDTKKNVSVDDSTYVHFLVDYEAAEKEIQTHNSNKLVNAFLSISQKCKLLLQAIFYESKPIETITKEFGYTNKHNAQNQKYKCLEQARRGVEIF